MNSFQEAQSDLEVILEFLEEYYRQNTGENLEKWHWAAGVAPEERCAPQEWASPCWTPYEQTPCKPAPHLHPLPAHAAAAAAAFAPAPGHAAAPPSDGGPLPKPASTRQLTSKHPAMAVGSRRKVRLFHFLFEMLEDPSMAHCVSWVPAAAGVFRFSSRNKDQLAALWGQRKGNKRPMTYQKMSRALRNYARSGEIFKVKKKLTYQFSQDTLTLLYQCRPGALS